MKNKETRRLCQAIHEGKVREVEHKVTHQHGEVIDCDGTGFEVKTGDKYQHWEGSNCDRD